MSPVPVTAVILTQNEELNIEACLRSVTGWVEQVVVVDSGSNDRTVDLCRPYTNDIVVHGYVDHASQWNWALNHAPIRCDWVLALDADNVVSPALKEQIGRVLARLETAADGYLVRHTHYFRNRPVRGLKSHWLRFFRRNCVHVDESELVDVRFVVDGRTATLSGDIVESNQKELSIDFWIDKHQKFAARMAAEEVLRAASRLERTVKPRLFAGPELRMLWLKERWYGLPLYVRPFMYFAYRYFVRLGCLDGVNGLVYHSLQALWFRMLVDLRIVELRAQLGSGQITLAALRQSMRPGGTAG